MQLSFFFHRNKQNSLNLANYINPFRDIGFKRIFGQEATLLVTAHDPICGFRCLPNSRPQRRSNLSTDYMVRPRWDRMYRSQQAIRKSLTLRLTEVRPFSRSVCTPLFYVKCRCNITSQVIEQFYQDLRDTELIYLLHSPNCSMAGRPTSCRHWFTCDASKSGARFPLPSI